MSKPDYFANANHALYDNDARAAVAYALTGILEQLTRIADIAAAVREDDLVEVDVEPIEFECPPVRAT